MLNDMACCHLQENLVTSMVKNTATKIGIDVSKTASKRVVQKYSSSYTIFEWK